MPNLHAKALVVTGFRGIRAELPLLFGKRLTIIYGGNATGKSSLAQAIEFAMSGQVLDHEGAPLPGEYLANTLSPTTGRVALTLTDGASDIQLVAATDESRNSIEGRFRVAASVEWTDRRIPVTMTHIMSQGALRNAIVKDALTRNDLSGLCTGSYLRFLLARAQKLADHFRQASSGRNMDAAIKEANSNYVAARALRDSLLAVRPASVDVAADPNRLIAELAQSADLPSSTPIEAIRSELEKRLKEADGKLASIARLSERMQDLGQYESELAHLRAVIAENVAVENDLLLNRETISAELQKQRDRESAGIAAQVRANAIINEYERYRQRLAAIETLAARRAQLAAELVQAEELVSKLARSLEDTIARQRKAVSEVARIEAAGRVRTRQREVVASALRLLRDLPEAAIAQSRERIANAQRLTEQLRSKDRDAKTTLEQAFEAEQIAAQALKAVSESAERFLAAASELRTFIVDDACSLCGSRHGTKSRLESAIDREISIRLEGAKQQREQLEMMVSARRVKEATYAQIANELQVSESALARAREESQQLVTIRTSTIADIAEQLRSSGLGNAATVEALTHQRDQMAATEGQFHKDVNTVRLAENEVTRARNDCEQELAARTAERAQYMRLLAELNEQISALSQEQPDEAVSSQSFGTARKELSGVDLELTEIKRSILGIVAKLAETDRAIAERRATRAGASRRLDVIDGLLAALDADLKLVGATRDVAALVSAETAARLHRDSVSELQTRLASTQKQINDLESYKSHALAESRAHEAESALHALQTRQARLRRRAAQFAEIQRSLELAQNRTAESVLDNVRVPLAMMFHAMTAGSQWHFSVITAEDGRVEARLSDSAGGSLLAGAILNSAYLNVAAIALRIALASQQNWTSLRTVVLDDPILEMDSLTQSALIDGIEAILTSPHTPWNGLQVILTTWSEDFAVLAAHKLAHINSVDSDSFAIYRLNSGPDGTVFSERHAPRWNAEASAA